MSRVFVWYDRVRFANDAMRSQMVTETKMCEELGMSGDGEQRRRAWFQRVGGALLVAATMCAMPSVSAAQEDAEQMQQLNAQAVEAFRAGEYERAAVFFLKAYDAKAEPTLIKNAMVAYYTADNCTESEKLALRYLKIQKGKPVESDPPDVQQQVRKDRRDAKTVVVKCRLQRAQAELAAGDPEAARDALDRIELYTPEEADAAVLIDLRDKIEAKEAEARAKEAEASEPKPPPKKDGMSGRKIAAFSLIGVGAAGLIGTGVYNLSAASRASELTETYPIPDNATADGPEDQYCSYTDDPAACQDDFDSLQTAGILLPIFYGISGAALVTGGVLLFTGDKDTEQRVTVAPMIGPGGAGATMRIRF